MTILRALRHGDLPTWKAAAISCLDLTTQIGRSITHTEVPHFISTEVTSTKIH